MKVLVVAALTVGLLGLFVVTAVRAPREVPFLAYKTVYASLAETGNLRVHAEVRVNGVRIGEVVDVRPDRSRARARLKLDPGVLDGLPADTTASVRGKGLLGARSVVLELGRSSQRLAENATMPPGRNPITLSVTDALETFDRETRRGLGTTTGELAAGLHGQSDELGAAIDAAAPAAADFNPTVEALLDRTGAVARLAPSLESAMAAVRRGERDIADGLPSASPALRPFFDRRSSVRATLAEAAATVRDAGPDLVASRPFVRGLRDVAEAANRTLPGAAGSLRSATALLVEGREPIARAAALLDTARPALSRTLVLSRAARPVLKPLQTLLDHALPTVQELGRHGCDIVDFGDNWRSTLNQGIAGGGLIGPLTTFRVSVIANPQSLSGVGKLDRSPVGRDLRPEPCAYSVPPRTYPTLSSRRKAGGR